MVTHDFREVSPDFVNDSAAVTHGDRKTASGEFSYARARTQQAARERKSDTQRHRGGIIAF
jgi:hypothetical protein